MEVSTEKTLVKTVKTQESRQGMCYFQIFSEATEGTKISQARGPHYTLKHLSDDQTVSEIHLPQLIISMQSDKHTHFIQ